MSHPSCRQTAVASLASPRSAPVSPRRGARPGAWRSGALLLSLVAAVPAAADITVGQVFYQRERFMPGTVFGAGGDLLNFFVWNVEPDGTQGTTGTYSQFNTRTQTLESGNMVWFPFSAFPNNFVPDRGFSYDPGLLGPWDITFTNGPDSVTVQTPSIQGLPAVPYVEAVKLTGGGTSPTISWHVPTGTTPAAVVLNVYSTRRPDGTPGLDILHNESLPTHVSEWTVPAVLSSGKTLEAGGRYAVGIQIGIERAPFDIGSWSTSAFDFTPLPAGSTQSVYLPSTIIGTDGQAEGFQFNGVPVTAGEPVAIDPDIAVGYEYAIGSPTDPRFRSVLLPADIGDGQFDIELFDGSAWNLSGTVQGNVVFDFGEEGVDRFRVTGIEASANLDPTDAMAFVTTLTFTADGTFNGTMTPITVAVPEPETYALMGLGLALLGFVARRRQRV